jgi:hypothetical protein
MEGVAHSGKWTQRDWLGATFHSVGSFDASFLKQLACSGKASALVRVIVPFRQVLLGYECKTHVNKTKAWYFVHGQMRRISPAILQKHGPIISDRGRCLLRERGASGASRSDADVLRLPLPMKRLALALELHTDTNSTKPWNLLAHLPFQPCLSDLFEIHVIVCNEENVLAM